MSESTPGQGDTIWVVGVAETASDRGLLFNRAAIERRQVDPAEIGDRLADLVAGLQSAIQRVSSVSAGWRLDELTVAVEIGAKGSVSLLGTGGEVSGSGGVTLKFARVGDDPHV